MSLLGLYILGTEQKPSNSSYVYDILWSLMNLVAKTIALLNNLQAFLSKSITPWEDMCVYVQDSAHMFFGRGKLYSNIICKTINPK